MEAEAERISHLFEELMCGMHASTSDASQTPVEKRGLQLSKDTL